MKEIKRRPGNILLRVAFCGGDAPLVCGLRLPVHDVPLEVGNDADDADDIDYHQGELPAFCGRKEGGIAGVESLIECVADGSMEASHHQRREVEGPNREVFVLRHDSVSRVYR